MHSTGPAGASVASCELRVASGSWLFFALCSFLLRWPRWLCRAGDEAPAARTRRRPRAGGLRNTIGARGGGQTILPVRNAGVPPAGAQASRACAPGGRGNRPSHGSDDVGRARSRNADSEIGDAATPGPVACGTDRRTRPPRAPLSPSVSRVCVLITLYTRQCGETWFRMSHQSLFGRRGRACRIKLDAAAGRALLQHCLYKECTSCVSVAAREPRQHEQPPKLRGFRSSLDPA